LNWDELTQPVHQELLAWYRQLIALKASALRPLSHAVTVSYDETAAWLCFVLADLCVAINFASQAVAFTLPKGNWRPLLTSSAHSTTPAQLAAFETRIHIQSL
jgi:pullulanase/glycogen debranching enzyme